MFTVQEVRQALALSEFDADKAHEIMMPRPRVLQRPPNLAGRARLGGVLLMLYCLDDELHLLLTRRRDDLPSHAGQVSFPGGRHEPPETLLLTALRETHEEVGVTPEKLEILGEMSPLYIAPSDFEVHPFVAWTHDGIRPQFRPDRGEVAEIIEVPLRVLLDPATRLEEPWELRGHEFTVPYFAVAGHKVWGATAMMLSEFIERLRRLR